MTTRVIAPMALSPVDLAFILLAGSRHHTMRRTDVFITILYFASPITGQLKKRRCLLRFSAGIGVAGAKGRSSIRSSLLRLLERVIYDFDLTHTPAFSYGNNDYTGIH
jgi:hypothetical protein